MPDVLVERGDGLIVITINRPEARNAVNRAVSYGVCEAVDELDARDDLRVGILTGAGGTFCAGMDLKAFLRGEVTRVEGRGILGIAMTPPRKPLIAAVEGYALAGGFEAVLACDLTVAARNAQFGIPEAKRGLAAAAGGLMRLPRLIPPRIAMELALTGDMISAERLAQLRPDQRPDRAGPGAGGGEAPGRQDHRQRAAFGRREQARDRREPRLAARRDVRAPAGDHRPGAAVGRRPRRCRGFRREAQTGLERPLKEPAEGAFR